LTGVSASLVLGKSKMSIQVHIDLSRAMSDKPYGTRHPSMRENNGATEKVFDKLAEMDERLKRLENLHFEDEGGFITWCLGHELLLEKTKKQIGGIHRRINNEIFNSRLSMRHKHSQISRIFKRLVALELKDAPSFEGVTLDTLKYDEPCENPAEPAPVQAANPLAGISLIGDKFTDEELDLLNEHNAVLDVKSGTFRPSKPLNLKVKR